MRLIEAVVQFGVFELRNDKLVRQGITLQLHLVVKHLSFFSPGSSSSSLHLMNRTSVSQIAICRQVWRSRVSASLTSLPELDYLLTLFSTPLGVRATEGVRPVSDTGRR